MSPHSTYETLRQLADSWGLLAMVVTFTVFALWPFRPGASQRNHDAAMSIFKEDDNG
ncbi:CcoQ/FixQ family Cbb3-type cytochrome c oxidase assembly chaperone [Novosphingobium sp. TH158]|nr:cbb3-type cytochrome c oxidase subunit 3 [Novosphingobium sp. TH158]PLK24492.1 CcoQ/FixQ family Cbb3-type cytochrome c oxidase assembly chaperone [Novosphingobium sp. TH158]